MEASLVWISNSQWRQHRCICLSCFSNNNDHFCPPPIFWIAEHQSTYYILAGFSILLMLIIVMMIMLKVFWIEVILLWRDIARPYKTRNGKWQVSSFPLKRKGPIMVVGYLSINLLIAVLWNPDSPLLTNIVTVHLSWVHSRNILHSALLPLVVLRFISTAQISLQWDCCPYELPNNRICSNPERFKHSGKCELVKLHGIQNINKIVPVFQMWIG